MGIQARCSSLRRERPTATVALCPEEIDEMWARITEPTDPALESARYALRAVVWQAVGHYQKAVVEFSRLEEGAR